ncbi:hypothetical protein [Streptomyces formicae]|uniref:Uncharacterized protein n=1 Tax=Streptomyces formicae TaxID=1616117 RepID=A0A291QAZ7_9ACTN|nr:hypothetical protein [Streptomyces formicae]ATL28738.1 hypothetical protein KY5_3720c [Streptomyces formicae]
MEWTALISTVAGGAIATLSAGALEFWRWKRQRVDQNIENRRVLYGSYLAVLSSTRHTCSWLARATELAPTERAKAVWDAYEHCLGRRYEIQIMAPLSVVEAADDTHHAMRAMCMAVEVGVTSDDEEYTRLRQAYKDAHTSLRRAMRCDLGSEP